MMMMMMKLSQKKIIIIIVIVIETIDNIISACSVLAKEQYIKRHDRVSAQLHLDVCKTQGYKWTRNTGTNMYQNQ